MNLADMSLNDLKDLLKKIPAEIKRRTDEAQNAAKEAAIEKLKAIAQEHGFTLEELTGKRKTKGAGSRSPQEPVAAKYAIQITHHRHGLDVVANRFGFEI